MNSLNLRHPQHNRPIAVIEKCTYMGAGFLRTPIDWLASDREVRPFALLKTSLELVALLFLFHQLGWLWPSNSQLAARRRPGIVLSTLFCIIRCASDVVLSFSPTAMRSFSLSPDGWTKQKRKTKQERKLVQTKDNNIVAATASPVEWFVVFYNPSQSHFSNDSLSACLPAAARDVYAR